MKQVRPFTYWTSVIVFGVMFGTGLQIVGAWTEPILPPPNGNISGPLTTSDIGQEKKGNLVISTLNTIVNGFIVAYGNVGIGTWKPQAKLDVNGKAISHSTIDTDPGNTLVTKDYVDAQMGGGSGITGGCLAHIFNTIMLKVEEKWGNGCLENGNYEKSKRPSSDPISAYCRLASADGFDCGLASTSGVGYNVGACICVKEVN